MRIEKIEIDNKKYPQLLRTIKNPPKQLYVLGNTEILNKPGIAIIGSRNCTDVGKRIARNFSSKLSGVRDMY